MPARVLDVGQCDPDHAAISRLLQSRFGAEIVRACGLADTLDALRRAPFALVLVNRKLDADYSDGLEIIKAIKADPSVAAVPVMLVSNYAEAHQEAVAVGALTGFGKAELTRPETEEKLRAVLAK